MHDIQDMPLNEKENEDDRRDICVDLPNPLLEDLRRTPPPQRLSSADDFSNEPQPRRSNIPRVVVEPPPAPSNDANQSNSNSNNSSSRRRRRSDDDDGHNNDDDEDTTTAAATERDNTIGSNAYIDIWAAAISIQHRNLRNTGTFNSAHVDGINSGIITSKLARKIPQLPIAQNTARLMYYIEEPSKGKGFIKELCFSSDGKFLSFLCKKNQF